MSEKFKTRSPTRANTDSMTDVANRNVEIVGAWHDAINRGDVVSAIGCLAEDACNFGHPVGRAGFRRVLEDIHATFPDWRMDTLDTVASADSVVVRLRVSATHRGVGNLPINGGLLVGVTPTGKRFEVQHIHWFRLRDGSIIDHFATRDDVGMMQQLGLLPTVDRLDTKPSG